MSRIWYAVNTLDRGRNFPLSLLSVGAINEAGDTFYAVNADMDLSQVVRDRWAQVNALPTLPIKVNGSAHSQLNVIVEWDRDNPDIEYAMAADSIADRFLAFVRETRDSDHIELWSWVGGGEDLALRQLFGNEYEVPPPVPGYTMTVSQEWDTIGRPPINLDMGGDHGKEHAMVRAAWTRRFHVEVERIQEELQVIARDVALEEDFDLEIARGLQVRVVGERGEGT